MYALLLPSPNNSSRALTYSFHIFHTFMDACTRLSHKTPYCKLNSRPLPSLLPLLLYQQHHQSSGDPGQASQYRDSFLFFPAPPKHLPSLHIYDHLFINFLISIPTLTILPLAPTSVFFTLQPCPQRSASSWPPKCTRQASSILIISALKSSLRFPTAIE